MSSQPLYLGIRIHDEPLPVLVEKVMSAIQNGQDPMVFACANPHSLLVAQNDHVFKTNLNSADILVADGAGLILMSYLICEPIVRRITGHDFFIAIMTALQCLRDRKVFFFGSSENVLQLIKERMARDFPNVEVSTLSPPFGDWARKENEKMLHVINASRSDVLWVGMTAPKQEKWVQANRDRLNCSLIASIGAVFDFLAGTHPRAPEWMCRGGVEWVYRLWREPRRMWRRNFVSTPKFVALILDERLRRAWSQKRSRNRG